MKLLKFFYKLCILTNGSSFWLKSNCLNSATKLNHYTFSNIDFLNNKRWVVDKLRSKKSYTQKSLNKIKLYC